MALTDDEEQELLLLLEAEERDRVQDAARSSLLAFTQYTYGDEFPYRPNWHHKVLCDFLDDLLTGEIKRLLVFMPPRHGKSELVSRRLPAFALGRNPRESIIACSYADDLAARMNRDVQRIMDGERYAELFPDVRLPGPGVRPLRDRSRKIRTTDLFELIDHDGSYRSAGIGGGITGMGASLGIIDDPVKNQAEALSPTIRQRHWEWYATTYRTRLQSNARELITMTRWHEDDLAGRTLAMLKAGVLDANEWVILSLPAINEHGPTEYDPRAVGEALWPLEYPLSFLEEQRKLGAQAFASLYQQRPSAEAGGIVQRKWLVDRMYTELPDGCRFLISCDLNFDETSDGSYNVMQVWAWKSADIFLVDQIRERCEFVEALRHFETLTKRYPQATIKLVEKKANGAALLSMMRHKYQGMIGVEPRGSKLVRLKAVASLIEAGNVHLPTWQRAPWVNAFVEEMVSFPNAANDDQVDAATQALNRLRTEAMTVVGAASLTRSAPIPHG